MSEKEHNPKPNGNSKRSLALVSIGTILAATGGPFLVVKLGGPSIYRDDPYTGSQGTITEARLDAHAQRIASLEKHVDNHPDSELRTAISALTAEMATGTAERGFIIKNQDEILRRLNAL